MLAVPSTKQESVPVPRLRQATAIDSQMDFLHGSGRFDFHIIRQQVPDPDGCFNVRLSMLANFVLSVNALGRQSTGKL